MNHYDLDHPLADLGLPNHELPDPPVEEITWEELIAALAELYPTEVAS